MNGEYCASGIAHDIPGRRQGQVRAVKKCQSMGGNVYLVALGSSCRSGILGNFGVEHSPFRVVKEMFIHTTCRNGMRGKHGPRNTALAVGCADSGHYPARPHLALSLRSPAMDRVANEHPAPYAASGAPTVEAFTSAVSWGAIFAGAVVAAAVSLILLALASGLGLASVSPWPNSGASLTTFSVTTGIGLIVVQWLASGLGGFVTGRLRTKWVGTHTHEVFFRDTAHGFITWALSTIIVATLLASAAASLVSAGAHGVAAVASGAMQGVSGAGTSATANSGMNPGQAGSANSGAAAGPLSPAGPVSAYSLDTLFRSAHPDSNSSNSSNADARAETARILMKGLTSGDVSAADRTYLAQLVAARTGVSDTDAQKRVDDTITQVQADDTKARQAADAARKASSAASLFTALSMVIGAFIACAAAALGGQLRDEHP
jgi:hypothetical protein